MHLELTTDLSTETFLSALRRFISRRERFTPSQIWSDNGTNFVGAQRQLMELHDFLRANENEVITKCGSEAIVWKFAIAPHLADYGNRV